MENHQTVFPRGKYQEVFEEMFDADFMLEGAKGSRGGKQKFKTKVV